MGGTKMRLESVYLLLIAVAVFTIISSSGGQQVKVEKVKYFGQPNCYKLSNDHVEVIVTTDIGPRIIAYRFIGDENILGELTPDAVVKTELGDWHPWGGHRLWHAPESKPRTYVPDDDPVQVELVGSDGIRLIQPTEKATGIEKEMFVKLSPKNSHVIVSMKLTNKGLWPVELAPWGLTIMNGGGTTIFPHEPYISHDEKLLPARPLVLWHYTDMSDPRWTWGKRFVRLKTDATRSEPQKVGAANKQGWAAYFRNGTLFVKRFPYVEGAKYPDYGCNFETYTAGDFMEVETLGPLVTLEPGQSTIHVEDWFLFKGVELGETDAELEATFKKILQQAR
jgi:hypothetical protein